VSSHFELPPSEYERQRAGHFHRRRVEVVADAVSRFVPSGGTVVEIGCGPGAVLAVLADLQPEGRLLAIEPNRLHPYVFAKQERMRRAGLDEDHFRTEVWDDAFRDAGLVADERRYLHAYPAWVRSA